MSDSPLTIVADENIPALEPLFGAFGRLRTCAGRTLSPEQVRDADVLLVRSVTAVNQQLLAGSRVRFVGTATIGTDHVDQSWLAEQGIGFSSAPGCNADSVVDYVLAALFNLLAESGDNLRQKTLGIVGVGNVGGRLQQRLEALGVSLLLCDPPRQHQEADTTAFVSLNELLQQADIICLHTPLTTTGRWPTRHLLHADNLKLIKPDAILLNAGRGPVVDNKALLALSKQRPDLKLVLDVWEHEPEVSVALAEHCRIATPHIAGYALDGKIRGTWMLYRALCQHLGRSPEIALDSVLPQAPVTSMTLSPGCSLLEPVRTVYDIYRDDRAFRQMLARGADGIPKGFDQLRRYYPERREFATLALNGQVTPDMAATLAATGFNCHWRQYD
ncbi:4-phosphoerythronate dehydrogenase PdxB [Marinobacterium sp. AK62]|uniref:Erythronate-4-phosphate dehydrogenase n=1 Tax=Marinobacterium alkalitolerans TaxID=1542925 RepID=A0ABS3ZE84_9GAMM|nr:4-phosphoerythronate dehydrogenase PdxB [Marinobacterium alkalitolerans]MBP0050018.1 4-phosphoerythronate dehydrogenase PdxB [Marinobacterium alkalitolerans]